MSVRYTESSQSSSMDEFNNNNNINAAESNFNDAPSSSATAQQWHSGDASLNKSTPRSHSSAATPRSPSNLMSTPSMMWSGLTPASFIQQFVFSFGGWQFILMLAFGIFTTYSTAAIDSFVVGGNRSGFRNYQYYKDIMIMMIVGFGFLVRLTQHHSSQSQSQKVCSHALR